jgi:hypothetical protein
VPDGGPQSADDGVVEASVFPARRRSRMEAELVNTPVGGPSRVKGLTDSIDPNKPLRNYRDAMQRKDRQEWAEAYDEEYQGFIEQETLEIARPGKGAKVLDTTTRANYVVTNVVFDKRKIRLCVCCNQQTLSKHF